MIKILLATLIILTSCTNKSTTHTKFYKAQVVVTGNCTGLIERRKTIVLTDYDVKDLVCTIGHIRSCSKFVSQDFHASELKHATALQFYKYLENHKLCFGATKWIIRKRMIL